MEEKILIKGEMDIETKSMLFRIAWTIIGVGIAALLLLFLPIYEGMRDDLDMGWELIIGSYGDLVKPYIFLISGCLFILVGVVLYFSFKALAMCEIEVTEYNVRGKSVGGKVVVLPLQQVSAYSTKVKTSTIIVATSSGLTKFSLIKNYEEIAKIISENINKKQEYSNDTTAEISATSSNMDDLVKLKSLLDQGIITQEEFDAKKKQLLGL